MGRSNGSHFHSHTGTEPAVALPPRCSKWSLFRIKSCLILIMVSTATEKHSLMFSKGQCHTVEFHYDQGEYAKNFVILCAQFQWNDLWRRHVFIQPISTLQTQPELPSKWQFNQHCRAADLRRIWNQPLFRLTLLVSYWSQFYQTRSRINDSLKIRDRMKI